MEGLEEDTEMRIACLVALLTICHSTADVKGDDQEEVLIPAAGTVTFTFTYLPNPADADNESVAKEETRSVTVPVNLIDKHGSKTVRFADLDCIVSYSVDTSILDINSRNPGRNLFRRMHSAGQNVSNNGIMGKNKVFNPLTGSSVQFTAFSGKSADESKESNHKPKIDIANLKVAKTLNSFANDELIAARKHANYGAFRECDRIVVGRIKVHELMVLESFPPIYEYNLHILLDGIIWGPKTKAAHIEAGYSQSKGALPNFDEDVVCVIGLAGRSLRVWTPANQAAVDAAIVATLDRKNAKDDDLSLAKEKPEQHKHFDFFRNSKSLALVRLHGSARSVTFSTSTKLETMKYKIVRNYRGDLSSGENVKLSAKSCVREPSFISYEKRGSDWVIIKEVAVSEAAMFVAANALDTNVEALEKLIAEDKLELKKEEADYAKQLEDGPAHGHSQSSEGSEASHGHTHGSDDVEGIETQDPPE